MLSPSPGGSQHEFDSTQTWCRTSGKNLRFLDQTLEVVRSYDESESDKDSIPGSNTVAADLPSDDPASALARPPKRPFSPSDELSQRSLDNESSCASQRYENIENRGPTEVQHSSLPIEDGYHFQQGSSEKRVTTEGNALENVVQGTILGPYPLLTFNAHTSPISIDGHWKDYDKEQLFRHFVNDLGPAFDLCDSSKTVAHELPERAAMSAPLLNLVLAVSSRHLSNTIDPPLFPEHMLDFYRYQFNETPAGPETHLAISALLLRFCQNIEGISSTTTSIPLDVHSNSKPIECASSSEQFLQAIFWARLRQELYLAIMSQAPMQLNMNTINIDNFIRPDEDEAWAKQMILYLVDTVQYCFGDAKDPTIYDRLLGQASAWAETKPNSFTPVYLHHPQDGSMLPEIWLLDDTIAAGLQFYHLVRILLTSHNPRIPRLGNAQKTATKWIDNQIKEDVRIICGIAESMNGVNPTHLTACMTIGLVGDRFTQRGEQTILFDILTKTSKQYGWSTTIAQKQLQEAWGWARINEMIT
ncbi:Fc.00g103960.m01.CDS01 [Cosmosporella sp. VM-42]